MSFYIFNVQVWARRRRVCVVYVARARDRAWDGKWCVGSTADGDLRKAHVTQANVQTRVLCVSPPASTPPPPPLSPRPPPPRHMPHTLAHLYFVLFRYYMQQWCKPSLICFASVMSHQSATATILTCVFALKTSHIAQIMLRILCYVEGWVGW